MPKQIVIVDDEQDILDLVEIHLKQNNFLVKKFGNGTTFQDWLSGQKNMPDMIILDLMLPDADGLDICKVLKQSDKFSNIPIIMLTAKSDTSDKILGLEIGADDYITKPFVPKELIARIKTVLRRWEKSVFQEKVRKISNLITIDFKKHVVLASNKPIKLTHTEFKILQLISEQPGWVYSRDQLLEHLWSGEKFAIRRSIDVHIRHLREKLGSAGTLIQNVRGIGYKIEENKN